MESGGEWCDNIAYCGWNEAGTAACKPIECAAGTCGPALDLDSNVSAVYVLIMAVNGVGKNN